MLKVITVTNNIQATQPLIKSLENHGWPYDIIHTEWHGFGTKLIETYKHLKNNPEITEFIFCDAFDVVALGGPNEFRKKLDAYQNVMICSGEKGCWPVPSLSKQYKHKEDGGFNYLNSGLYYSPANVFIDILESDVPGYESDDQLYLTEKYLFKGCPMTLDQKQILFNSHSFISEGEYTYENNRIQILGNEPVFIHFNGRTIDPKFNENIVI